MRTGMLEFQSGLKRGQEMRVNKLALIALVIGVALLCVFGYSLTQKWKIETVEKIPVYNFEGEQIGYVEIPAEPVYTAWLGIGTLSLIGGITLTGVGLIFLRPDDP